MLEALASRVRELRQEQHKNAAMLGVSHANLSRVERGSSLPSLATVERLAEHLGILPGTLFLPEAQYRLRRMLDDEFVREVQACLKVLSAEQKAYILKVLAAAPVAPRDGRQAKRG